MTQYKLKLNGLDCANCAAKLEDRINKLPSIQSCTIDFMNLKCVYTCADGADPAQCETEIREIIQKMEPDVVVTEYVSASKKTNVEETPTHECGCGHEHSHHDHSCEHEHEESECGCGHEHSHHDHEESECGCGHEHSHHDHACHCGHDHDETPHPTRTISGTHALKLDGLDCADCAAKLEGKILALAEVKDCSIDFLHLKCSYCCTDETKAAETEQKIRAVIAKEEPDVKVSVYSQASSVKKAEPKEEEENDFYRLPRLIVGAILFVAALFLSGTTQMVVSLIAWGILGCDVLYMAVKGITRGQIFDEHFLMAVATLAALYLQDWKEAAGVMLFYQIGEYFQDRAVERSRASISSLMDIRPEFAMVKRGDNFEKVDPTEVAIGDIIRVKPGERVPLDGKILTGSSSLNTASLTGESKLRDVDAGDEVLSGSVNETGVLEIQTTKVFGESTVARILDLVENSESTKGSTERFITKFSRIYTPTVVIAAILVAIVTGILTGDFNIGIERACTFLVISCPCALVISVPLSFFAGIGGLSSHGVLVKGSTVIESLAKVDSIVMDKTGTLTSGKFAVEETRSLTVSKEEILKDASAAEHFSTHPIAEGIRSSCQETIADSEVTQVEEIAGRGLRATYQGHTILAGNYRLMVDSGIPCTEESTAGTLVYVAKDQAYEGCLVLRDQLKPDAKKAVSDLHSAGKKCYIVSGDNQELTSSVGKELGVDGAYGGCMPEDKVNTLKKLKDHGTVAFIGDGINDAPVIVTADVGMAMGALGSDAAIEAADVVLMDDQPSKISLAITSSKRVLTVAKQNIWFAIGVKLIILMLGAFGYAGMWAAVFADTGVAMLCVLNSMRLLHISRKQ